MNYFKLIGQLMGVSCSLSLVFSNLVWFRFVWPDLLGGGRLARGGRRVISGVCVLMGML